jgi:type I restriction enzyme S subunit
MNLTIDKTKWKKVKLNDVCDWYQKNIPNDNQIDFGIKYYVTANHIESDSTKFKRYSELSDGQKGPTITKHFEKGDLLLSTRSVALRKASIAPVDGVTGEKLLVLRTKENSELIEELMPFVFQSIDFWGYAQNSASGSVNKFTSWTKIREYEFLLPPKEQQPQLAELLWAMDEVIEREREVLRKLLITNDSLCKSNVDFGYDSNKLKLPDGWRMMKVKDFSIVQAGSTPLRSNKEFFNNGIHPWVKTLDLNNDSVLSTEEKITDLALKKTSCKLREVGTILVAMYGGFNQIGRTGLLEIEAATNQAISAVMMDQNIVLPEYLLLVLNTKINYWKKVAISSRKDPNITKVDVENFPVPVPSLPVQESILLNTNSILKSIENVKSKISSSKALQKSLINQVF